jgi:hypothetical protein
MIDGGNKITHGAFSIFIEHAEANSLHRGAIPQIPSSSVCWYSMSSVCFFSNAKRPGVA